VTNCVCTEIGELTLENDFLSGALGKAGLLGGKK
jgi:transposase